MKGPEKEKLGTDHMPASTDALLQQIIFAVQNVCHHFINVTVRAAKTSLHNNFQLVPCLFPANYVRICPLLETLVEYSGHIHHNLRSLPVSLPLFPHLLMKTWLDVVHRYLSVQNKSILKMGNHCGHSPSLPSGPVVSRIRGSIHQNMRTMIVQREELLLWQELTNPDLESDGNCIEYHSPDLHVHAVLCYLSRVV